MALFKLLRHPALLGEIVIADFLPWYLVLEPMAILRTYGSYVRALNQILSLPFLLRTLLSPWKSITDQYPPNLLQLRKFTEALVLNLLSRGIGLIIRIVTMIFTLALHVMLLLGFFTFLFCWYLYPVLFVLAIRYLAPLFS